MESFISHYERHASYSDMGPNDEQLKLHHLHLTKLHMYGYDLAWLPEFVSNVQNRYQHAESKDTLAGFVGGTGNVCGVPPSLSKQKTRGNNHPRTELLPPIERGIDTYICQIQHIGHPVLANAFFFSFFWCRKLHVFFPLTIWAGSMSF